MHRIFIIFVMVLFCLSKAEGQTSDAVVADAHSHKPLPNAIIFDPGGKRIGTCNSKGQLPYIPTISYPITIRHLGYKEKIISKVPNDTIFLHEDMMIELPEVVVNSRNRTLLHIVAYVREYSTMTTYTDTVFMFREKMVDYMLPTDKKVRFKGWNTPRILTSKSYYHFTNAHGLDSVSDRCNHHFSWADWIGIAPAATIPSKLLSDDPATEIIPGKYTAKEIWRKNGDNVTLDINVIADTTCRKWVPTLSQFFRKDIDFEKFRVNFHYEDVIGDKIMPIDLADYSFEIESNGRGHSMFMFNRINEPFFVSTRADVAIVDKEYITLKEAKKWDRIRIDNDDIAIYEPSEVPELSPEIQLLIDRVNALNHDEIRLAFTPDKRLEGRHIVKLNVGQQLLKRLKQMFGIDNVNATRKWKRQWSDFRKDRVRRNKNQDNQ